VLTLVPNSTLDGDFFGSFDYARVRPVSVPGLMCLRPVFVDADFDWFRALKL
jgi:hypothetical protein